MIVVLLFRCFILLSNNLETLVDNNYGGLKCSSPRIAFFGNYKSIAIFFIIAECSFWIQTLIKTSDFMSYTNYTTTYYQKTNKDVNGHIEEPFFDFNNDNDSSTSIALSGSVHLTLTNSHC